MASACRQRQKTVQIHDMQDHLCLNKRHIYQIRIDLSAIMAWHCLCHLGRNNNNKKRTIFLHEFLLLYLFIYLVILCALTIGVFLRSFLSPPSFSTLPPSFSLFTYSICQPCSHAVSSPTFWPTSYFLPGPVIKACRTALPWAVESGSEGWRDRWWRSTGREG